jgi:O-antigen ligase
MDPDPAVPAIAHPHNNFLYMAVSFGVTGLMVFVWFLWVTIASGWRYRHTVAGYMLLCVVGVMVTTGLFNSQILDVGTAFLLSLTVGLEPAFKWSDGDA